MVGDPAELSSLSERKDLRVMVVETLQQVEQVAQQTPIDVLVLSDKIAGDGLKDLPHIIDVSKTLVMSGPLSVQNALDSMQGLLHDQGSVARRFQEFQDLTLEYYCDLKFRKFVRDMKASAAKNLHATLMRAVERILIQNALRETNGNQIQASQLLGLNRNTLRKKITEYHILVPRRSRQRAQSSSG